MILRIVLLFVLIKAIGTFEGSVFKADNGLFEGDFNLHSLIVLFGGVFIIYTATSEIIHMHILIPEKMGIENQNLPTQ